MEKHNIGVSVSARGASVLRRLRHRGGDGDSGDAIRRRRQGHQVERDRVRAGAREGPTGLAAVSTGDSL